MIDQRIAICVAASLAAHFALGRGLAQLPPRPSLELQRKVEIRVVTPPPPPEPPPELPKPPDPPKPPEPQVVHERPRVKPAQPAVRAETPKDTPPVDHAPVVADTTTTPVYGVTMESTSQSGGPAMPVGNTTRPQPAGNAAPAEVKPLAAPVAAYEVTRMPIPQGRCSGKYTDAARAASLEGTVVLDLIVDEHGRARDIQVVSGLGHGLTEAAITALSTCRFTPGEKAGAAVPVRVRGFKIRFLLQDGE